MAGPSWAQVATSRVKLTTPYKITYHRQEPNPVLRLQQVERLVKELLQENLVLKKRISDLEEKADQKLVIKGEIAKEVMEECISKPDQRLVSVLQSAVAAEGRWIKSNEERIREEEAIQKQIQASLAEEKDRAERALNVRIGGVDRSIVESLQQHKQGREDLLIRHFGDSYDIRIAGITNIKLQGPQVVLSIRSKQDRTEILRQAHKLKGTKIWIAEDLTKEQLSRKREELQKVKQARMEGYWARYLNGEAVIRKFRESGTGQIKQQKGDQ